MITIVMDYIESDLLFCVGVLFFTLAQKCKAVLDAFLQISCNKLMFNSGTQSYQIKNLSLLIITFCRKVYVKF